MYQDEVRVQNVKTQKEYYKIGKMRLINFCRLYG